MPVRIEVYSAGRWIGADLIEFMEFKGFTFAKAYPDDTIGADVYAPGMWRGTTAQ